MAIFQNLYIRSKNPADYGGTEKNSFEIQIIYDDVSAEDIHEVFIQ